MEIPFVVLIMIVFIAVVGIAFDPDRYPKRKKKKRK